MEYCEITSNITVLKEVEYSLTISDKLVNLPATILFVEFTVYCFQDTRILRRSLLNDLQIAIPLTIIRNREGDFEYRFG